jgi:hypothetical protein
MEIRKDKSYRAYLLRCWQDEPAAWRFSVEEVRAEPRRRGLRDLEALVTFLRSELIAQPSHPDRRERGADDGTAGAPSSET